MNKPTRGGRREGAGRPPVDDKKERLTIRLRPDDREYLLTIAETYSGAVEKMIRERRG